MMIIYDYIQDFTSDLNNPSIVAISSIIIVIIIDRAVFVLVSRIQGSSEGIVEVIIFELRDQQ